MPDDFDTRLKSPEPTPAIEHKLGQNLDALSIAELNDRIRALNAEIARLEAAKSDKERSAKAAAAIFKI